MNLSRTHTSEEEVRVVAVSNIPGHSEQSIGETIISAVCKASGFRLVGISRQGVVKVRIDAGDFRKIGTESFGVTADDILRYVPAIFGPGVEVEAFQSRVYRFNFPRENCRKVPVIPVKYLSFRSQYMAKGDMRTEPDSVYVYGEPDVIDGINQIITEPISMTGLSRSIRGEVQLEPVPGVRLSAGKVRYEMDVTRYVELKKNIPLSRIQAPSGTELLAFPSTISVTARCAFPMGANPLEHTEVYIDYGDFLRSPSGRCIVRVRCPESDNVLSWRLEPSACDCIER